MNEITKKKIRRQRTRARIYGTKKAPRLNVFVSNKYIFAQIIDDDERITLVSATDRQKGFRAEGKKVEIAKEVGRMLAKKAKEKKIVRVVFDKGHKLYHGRVAALAEGAREGGLKF